MCNSAEQAGVEQASDSRKDNGLTSDVFCPNTADCNSNIGENFDDTSVKDVCKCDRSHLANDSCCDEVLGSIPLIPDLRPYAISMENGMMDTLPLDKEVCPKPVFSETETDALDRVKLKKKDMQETEQKTTANPIVTLEASGGNSGYTTFEVTEVPGSILEPGGYQVSPEVAELAVNYTYKGKKELDMQEHMQKFDDTEVQHFSVAESVREFECHSACPCTERREQNRSTLKQEATQDEESLKSTIESVTCIDERQGIYKELTDKQSAMRSQKEATDNDRVISNTCEATDNDPVICIAAGSQLGADQIDTETVQSKQATKEIVAFEITGNLVSGMALGSEESALEHGQKKSQEAFQDSSIQIDQQEAKMNPWIENAINTKDKNSNVPELAKFFSNARAMEHEVEIEEQDQVPIRIKSSPKRKSYRESPRSLRILLFSDETASFVKKEEKHKRDGKGMEFSNKVVPAFERIGDESHIDDINFPKWHAVTDNVEASSDFSGPLALSGALTYQGMISYAGPVTYSGSISHRSDSSTSTRSFAFPILASEWNASPVKMGAPDPRFFRQQRKWQLCSCCKRPSTLFD